MLCDYIVYYIIILSSLVYVVTDRQVAVYCYVSDAPSAKSFVNNTRTCAFIVALMYWVEHAMLNASVILPSWPSQPTWHWKTAFCCSTCIHTFVYTHQTAWSCSLSLRLNCHWGNVTNGKKYVCLGLKAYVVYG